MNKSTYFLNESFNLSVLWHRKPYSSGMLLMAIVFTQLRWSLKIISLILLPIYCWSSEVLIETPQGRLLGVFAGADNLVQVYKGIPYGVPPVGIRRWQHAQKAPAWKGIRRAQAYGPECMQPSTMDLSSQPESEFFYHPPGITSEDCLYLNVWTPGSKNVGQGRAVMVWLHGGGFIQGAGSWPLYNGEELAKKGVVVVTINYRLGIFGFLAHPELSAESAYHSSGTYGTLDQILALEWVRENIRAFGGDPNNVTIFGESAGAVSVSQLLESPLADGLFHRAIIQSHAFILKGVPLTEAEAAGTEFVKAIGRNSIQEVRAIPAADLLKAVTLENNPSMVVVQDNWLRPALANDLSIRAKGYKVPIIFGLNGDEPYRMPFTKPFPFNTKVGYIQFVKEQYGELAGDFLSMYPADNWQHSAYRHRKYSYRVWESEQWAKMVSRAAPNIYFYFFDHIPAGAESAFHTAEISYVFNNEKYSVRYSPNMPADPPRASDLALAGIMSDYWVAFAKTGIPAAEGLPAWKHYTAETEHFIYFKEGKAHPSANIFPGAWELQDKIKQQKNRKITHEYMTELGGKDKYFFEPDK